MAVELQDHIHISSSLENVTENDPSSRWKVTADGWSPEPEVFLQTVRTFGGQLRVYAARNTSGGVLVAQNYSYKLILRDEFGLTSAVREAYLLGMLGKTVYVHHHSHDESAHDTGYKPMLLSEIGDWSALDPLNNYQTVSIRLQDINP